eukprot:TRINITY_DN12825_c0_g2_i12.p1 TRINITY_DN12825_c0_g2~~TRINITY_DN12825_c0_g2_i12.p1  ORF type:complete len:170 (-),score=36.92 TRINITY_DN12825_c0_g2_i12:419-928(-)
MKKNRVEEDGIEVINLVPLGMEPVSMSRISMDSEAQRMGSKESANEKSTRHRYTTPEVKVFLHSANRENHSLFNKNNGQYFNNAKEFTTCYQNSVSGLKFKKAWKKGDNKLEVSSSNLAALRPKVLIVEDNQFNVLPMKGTLDKSHIEYDWAKNGLMAVDRYEQTMKDL